MKIIHILTQTELTGSEVFTWNLVKAQIQNGHDVWLVSDEFHLNFQDLFPRGKAPEAMLFRFPLSARGVLASARNFYFLRKLFRSIQPDMIHCHSRGAARHAHRSRMGLGIPMLSTLHGRQHFSFSKKFFWKSFGDRITLICENLAHSFRDELEFPQHKIDIVRNPFPLEDWKNFDTSSFTAPNNTDDTTSLGPIKAGVVGRSTGPKGERICQLCRHVFPELLRLFPHLEISFAITGLQNLKACEASASPLAEALLELSRIFKGRIFVEGSPLGQDLRSWYSRQHFIIGGGRVAIESSLKGLPVFVLGEYSYEGLLTENTFASCLDSNFGDIGSSGPRELPLPLQEISADVSHFIKHRLFDKFSTEKLCARISALFSLEQTVSDMELAYKKTRFDFYVPKWIPILMYHKIPEGEIESPHKTYVTKANFLRHCQFFKKRKFTTLWFSELLEFFDGRRSFTDFPTKPLILTFDDGYRDNLLHAQPLLLAHGLKANLFLLGTYEFKKNTWDPEVPGDSSDLLSEDERQLLDTKGVWEIGSHGSLHQNYTQMDSEAIFTDLKQSKTFLEKEFQKTPVAVAYPFGKSNASTSAAAQASGYRLGINTDKGGMSLTEDLFQIFRVNIFPNENFLGLFKKTHPSYRKRFARRRT